MRIRTIKPEFWTHEGLCSLSEFSRLLAIALLNLADDEGYFYANPAILRGSLFPFLDDSTKIPRSVQDLSRVGWIELGEDSQKRAVGRIVNFAKHQRVDKPKPSAIKASAIFQDASKTPPGFIQDASKEERKGKEGEQGKEGNTPQPPKGAELSAEQIRVARWFGRKPTTAWSDKELSAWKKIHKEAILEGVTVLEGPYSTRAVYVRKDLLTLLNNWQGEIDRWRNYRPAQKSNVTSYLPGEVDEEGNPAWINS